MMVYHVNKGTWPTAKMKKLCPLLFVTLVDKLLPMKGLKVALL